MPSLTRAARTRARLAGTETSETTEPSADGPDHPVSNHSSLTSIAGGDRLETDMRITEGVASNAQQQPPQIQDGPSLDNNAIASPLPREASHTSIYNDVEVGTSRSQIRDGGHRGHYPVAVGSP